MTKNNTFPNDKVFCKRLHICINYASQLASVFRTCIFITKNLCMPVHFELHNLTKAPQATLLT